MPWEEIEPMNQRTEFVLRATKTDNFRDLCREYGISTKTGYKWRERFLEYGLSGMAELSRRPKNSPDGLDEAVVCEIVRLKQRHRHWGDRKLRKVYERMHSEVPSESSFKRVLDRAGLVEERRLRSRHKAGRLFSGRKAKAPNEIWTVDLKGWWHGANDKRCEPLTVRDEFSRYVLELRAMSSAGGAAVRRRRTHEATITTMAAGIAVNKTGSQFHCKSFDRGDCGDLCHYLLCLVISEGFMKLSKHLH